MRARLLLVALLAVVTTQLGALNCNPAAGPGTIQITGPAPGTVTSFSFDITFQLVGGPFVGAPQLFLNFQPVVATDLGGGQYSATINPGAPLEDENFILVKATRQSDGVEVKAGRPFTYGPPKARVFQITDLADCPVTGPLAHVRVGDYCLENADARFVVQDITKPGVPTDPTPRDFYSVGQFGGNIIDAVVPSNSTTDNFLEIQAMVNIETVVNYQTEFVIDNDGADGTAAVFHTCGPDDLLDFANPSSQIIDAGLAIPICPPSVSRNCFDDNDQDVWACTTYTLEPGDQFVKVETEITNSEPNQLRPFVGDWMNVAGEVDGFFKPNVGIGESIFDFATGGMSWYAETPIEGTDRFEYGYVPQSTQFTIPGPGSYVTISGVTVILHDMNAGVALSLPHIFPSPFLLEPGGSPGDSRTYTRYVTVGDGGANAAADLAQGVLGNATGTVSGCVTVGGAPAKSAKVTIGTLDTGAIDSILAHFVTDAAGCYSGLVEVPPAAGTDYGAVAAKDGALYVGGAATPPVTTFELFPAGDAEVINFALPAAGTLNVDVTDESGGAVPARITVVGFDPSPEPTIPTAPLTGAFGTLDLGLFNDQNDALRGGIVAFQHTGANGNANFMLEPGSYHVYASRGTEYSAWSTVGTGAITISGGVTENLVAQIAHVVDTSGFISSDHHVHGIASADSQVNDVTRAREFAGEGVDNIVSTDHHVHHDYKPAIAAEGLASFVTGTIGEEITTFDYGHFNSYPQTIDTSVPSGGSTDWGVAEPPGEDFPSLGAYNLPPSGIFTLATTNAQSLPDTTLQVNHIDSHFAPLKIDTSINPPTDAMTAADRLSRRLDPASPPLGQLYHQFDALEVWNGYTRNHQLNEFLGDRIGIWFNLLDQDRRITAIGDTDTHDFRNQRSAGARTWSAASAGKDSPATLLPSEMGQSIQAGKATAGQGIYVQTRLLADDGSGGIADLTWGGSTGVQSVGGDVTLEITVQSPEWAQWDTIEIYSNAGGNVSSVVVDALEPYLYGATPLVTKVEGDCDPTTTGDGNFDITVDEPTAVVGAKRWSTTVTHSFTGLSAPTWFVALVRGTDGACGPMFPVFSADLLIDPGSGINDTLAKLVDGNVGEDGVMAMGVTNALYLEP